MGSRPARPSTSSRPAAGNGGMFDAAWVGDAFNVAVAVFVPPDYRPRAAHRAHRRERHADQPRPADGRIRGHAPDRARRDGHARHLCRPRRHPAASDIKWRRFGSAGELLGRCRASRKTIYNYTQSPAVAFGDDTLVLLGDDSDQSRRSPSRAWARDGQILTRPYDILRAPSSASAATTWSAAAPTPSSAGSRTARLRILAGRPRPHHPVKKVPGRVNRAGVRSSPGWSRNRNPDKENDDAIHGDCEGERRIRERHASRREGPGRDGQVQRGAGQGGRHAGGGGAAPEREGRAHRLRRRQREDAWSTARSPRPRSWSPATGCCRRRPGRSASSGSSARRSRRATWSRFASCSRPTTSRPAIRPASCARRRSGCGRRWRRQ